MDYFLFLQEMPGFFAVVGKIDKLQEIFVYEFPETVAHVLEIVFFDAVENPAAVSFGIHDSGIPENFQMLGDPRLFYFKNFRQIVDTEGFLGQELQYFESRLVSESLEYLYETFHKLHLLSGFAPTVGQVAVCMEL